MSKEFSQLKDTAKDNPLWDVENIAFGNKTGKEEIQISGTSVSSSLFDMLPSVIDACTEKAVYIGKETIAIFSEAPLF